MFLSIQEFVGHLHPVLVHLPIGILLVGLLLQLLSRNPANNISPSVIRIVLLCGLVSAILSSVSGYMLSLSGDYEEDLVDLHMWMGFAVVLVAFFLYVKIIRQQRDRLYSVLSVGLLLLITITGHLGGSLTHGADYLTAPLENAGTGNLVTRKPIPDIKEAKIYADVVQPLIQANCVGCHGPNRQKGKLRLDDSVWMCRGGKDGLVLHPFKPEESELIKRILLPSDDEHRMPPKEKHPLKESEIAILRWWVAQGSDFSRKVKELPQPPRIASYLLALQDGNSAMAGSAALVPDSPVAAASEKDIELLRAKKVEIIPVSQGSHYLSANFINAVHFTNRDLELLLPLKKQLVWLKLGGQPVGDSGLVYIGQCQALTVLHLNNTRINDSGLLNLKNLYRLRILNLVGTSVTAKGVSSLSGLRNLQSLYLYKTGTTPGDWGSLQKSFPKTLLDSGGYSVPFNPWDTVNELKPKPVK